MTRSGSRSRLLGGLVAVFLSLAVAIVPGAGVADAGPTTPARAGGGSLPGCGWEGCLVE
jgi:hypothetical protein